MKRSTALNLVILIVLIFSLPLSVLLFISADSKDQFKDVDVAGIETIKKQRTDPTIPETNIDDTDVDRIDWITLQNELNTVIETESPNYAYVVQDLETGELISHNKDMDLPPASIYKIPLAILALQEIDNGSLRFDTYLEAKEIEYETDIISSTGTVLNVDTTIQYMITYSDNTAVRMIERALGGVFTVNELLSERLGLNNFARFPDQHSSADQVRKVLFDLYNDDLLSKESKEYLMNLMINTPHNQRDRIPAGVPDNIEVAHKIGNLKTSYSDAAIVFGEKRDYILIVMNKDINNNIAREKIEVISSIVYEALN